MRLRFIHSIVIISALGTAACAGRAPAVLNAFSGPDKPDSEVALVRPATAAMTTIDGNPMPQHPDPEKFYYRDVRLLPGEHSFVVHRVWWASVLVAPSGHIEGSQAFAFEVEAGHIYELHAARTIGHGYRLFFWVEDTTAGKIVAGEEGPWYSMD